jgi:hypothetical protein
MTHIDTHPTKNSLRSGHLKPVTQIKSEGRLVRIFGVRSPRIDRSRVIALEQTAAHEAVSPAAHAALDHGDGMPVHPGGRVEDDAPGRRGLEHAAPLPHHLHQTLGGVRFSPGPPKAKTAPNEAPPWNEREIDLAPSATCPDRLVLQFHKLPSLHVRSLQTCSSQTVAPQVVQTAGGRSQTLRPS